LEIGEARGTVGAVGQLAPLLHRRLLLFPKATLLLELLRVLTARKMDETPRPWKWRCSVCRGRADAADIEDSDQENETLYAEHCCRFLEPEAMTFEPERTEQEKR
jgi:hypothetical protein